MSAAEAPILLTRVCNGWRSAAFSFPRLWARLHIPIPGGQPDWSVAIDDEAGGLSQVDVFTRVLELRGRAVEQWLSRSGKCLLSLSISNPASPFPHATHLDTDDELDSEPCPQPRKDDFSRTICNIVVSYAHRLQDLEMSIPLSIYKQIQDLVPVSQLGMLRALRLSIPIANRSQVDAVGPIKFLEAANLRGMSISLPQAINLTSPIHWDNLSYLSILSSLPDILVLDLLKRCHNLLDCHLAVKAPWPHQTPERRLQEEESLNGTAYLPHLKSLDVDDNGSTRIMMKTWKSIHAPSLEYVRYTSYLWHGDDASDDLPNATIPPDPAIPDVQRPFPFLALLENNGTSVSKLALDAHSLSRQDLIQILKSVSGTLTHLELGKKTRRSWFAYQTPYMTGRYRSTVPGEEQDHDFTFDILSLDLSSDNNSVFLPHLEVLLIRQLLVSSDKSLLRFILGRIEGHIAGKVAPLKHVTVAFDREKQMDIAEAVSKSSQAAGLNIKLELDYATPRPKHLQILSPSYGLTTCDYSWIYQPAEMETLS